MPSKLKPFKINTIDDAADYMNTASDWVVVDNKTRTVLREGLGDCVHSLKGVSDDTTLYVLRGAAAPSRYKGKIVSVSLDHLGANEPSTAGDKTITMSCKRCFKPDLIYDDNGLCPDCHNLYKDWCKQAESLVASGEFEWCIAKWNGLTKGNTTSDSLMDRLPVLAHNGKQFEVFVSNKVTDLIDQIDAGGYGCTIVAINEAEARQAVKGETGAETVIAREATYGPFAVHAKVEQDLLKALQSQPNWSNLTDVQKSALNMIMHKTARILNGTPNHADNWHDIAGYATLAEQEILNNA